MAIEFNLGSVRIRFQRVVSVLVAIAGTVAAISTFLAGWHDVGSGRQVADSSAAAVERAVEQSKKDYMADNRILRERIAALEDQLGKLSAVAPDTAVAIQLSALDKSVSDTNVRMGKIEQVILEDPAKALEMPLLRNQLDSVKSGYQTELLSVKQEIAQVYDLNKWFIGLMFTMALGIVGLAVTNFLKAGKKDDE